MDIQVNFYSLLLLFAVSLIVHLLISHLNVICEKVRLILLSIFLSVKLVSYLHRSYHGIDLIICNHTGS